MLKPQPYGRKPGLRSAEGLEEDFANEESVAGIPTLVINARRSKS